MEQSILTVKAKLKEKKGKGVAKKIRAKGNIPAIYYGPGKENITIEVNPRDIIKILHKPKKTNTVFNLDIENHSQKQVIIKDYEFHPVTRSLLHCDFYDVTDKRKVTIKVPVKLKGRTEGEKIGGKNNWIVRELKIKTFPTNIPDFIEVNIEGLKIGQQIRISQIPLPEGIEAVYRIDQPVIISNAPKRIAEPGKPEENND